MGWVNHTKGFEAQQAGDFDALSVLFNHLCSYKELFKGNKKKIDDDLYSFGSAAKLFIGVLVVAVVLMWAWLGTIAGILSGVLATWLCKRGYEKNRPHLLSDAEFKADAEEGEQLFQKKLADAKAVLSACHG